MKSGYFLTYLFLLVSGFFIGVLTIQGTKDENIDETYLKNFINKYQIYAVNHPESASFANEVIPLWRVDIKERYDREILVNTYWQSNALLMIKRANKYFPIVEPIIKKYGIPEDFKFLMAAESTFMNVTSPAGAKGMWQLMKSAAKENGLEVNGNVDERYHLEKATEVACKYILKNKKRFGTWALSAAAYNMGPTRLKRYLSKQKVDSYYDLVLPDETARYMFRLMAIKQILEDPNNYGFKVRDKDLYKQVPTMELEVDSSITNLVNFSSHYNISYKVLKIHNPWLKQDFLKNNSGKKYIIKIPRAGYYEDPT